MTEAESAANPADERPGLAERRAARAARATRRAERLAERTERARQIREQLNTGRESLSFIVDFALTVTVLILAFISILGVSIWVLRRAFGW